MPLYSRRLFLKKLGMGAAALMVSGLSDCHRRADLPNIVIIFTDDQGYADVGCYGARGFTTPNLDAMANEGMRFTNFYVSQAVCSASRASLLTGCYAERVGIRGALMPWSNVGLHPDEETIADLLKKQGYTTAIFGKWHLGHHKDFLPTRQGFDEYLGLPYSNDMWPVDFDGKPITMGRKSNYPPLPLLDGETQIDAIETLDDQATLTTRYTRRAVRFIEKNKNHPFFLYMPHSMPHVPLGVSEKFRSKSKQGMYGDVIMEIDWSVGEILDAVKRNGLDEKTFVIFASDNGPWLNFGNHAGCADPLREGKGAMWEGGARVPCIMRWPGHIPPGTTCDRIAATIDILPTIAAITGAPLPQRPIDGVNILPLLSGDFSANPRDHYFYYYGGELRAVRKGRWKLVFPHEYRSYQGVEPGKDGHPGPYAKGRAGLELYDLETDISESHDVAAQHPEVVKRLQVLAEKARTSLGDKLTGVNGRDVREPGRLGQHRQREVKHLAVGGSVKLAHPCAKKYAGSGPNALVDGRRGTIDYADGNWQGFEANDLVAVIDMGKMQTIHRIKCSFLSDQMAWIFLPTEVQIALSADGTTFYNVRQFRDPLETGPQAFIKEYTTECGAKKARYVRIRATNQGICPQWHQGAGGKAWLFVDEVVVE